MKNDYICIIPARSGSTSIKNKNLRLLNNKPLIYFTIKAAINSKKFTNIIVSSNSNKILNYSKKFNIDLHKRSTKNSRNNSTTHNVIKEIITSNFLNFKNKNIVILQPTSPFRNAKHIKEAIKKFEDFKKADCLVSVQKCPHNMIPESLMKKSRHLLKFNQKNFLYRKQDKPIYYARNGAAIYITKHNRIKKYILGGNIIYFEMNKIHSIDIDDPEDLDIARILASKMDL